MEINKGTLLVATPAILNDNLFKRTVILLAEHTPTSAVGFILNRPTIFKINDVLPQIKSDLLIYEGGPVEKENLYFIHKVPELISDSIKIKDDIYWGGNFKELTVLLNNNKLNAEKIRFFLGYAGWGASQLAEEIHDKSWFVSEHKKNSLFEAKTSELWKEKMIEKGGTSVLWSNAPSDVNLN